MAETDLRKQGDYPVFNGTLDMCNDSVPSVDVPSVTMYILNIAHMISIQNIEF